MPGPRPTATLPEQGPSRRPRRSGTSCSTARRVPSRWWPWRRLGQGSLAGKVLVDVANPLDFSGGFPPRLSVSGDDSLGEQIQRAFPNVRVVKALNTVTASVMVDPGALAQQTDLFVAGDDSEAKRDVVALLGELGWSPERVRDLGGIAAARVTEGYLMLWLALMDALGSAAFNVRVVTVEGQP